RFWRSDLGYFVASQNYVSGANYKNSGLDVAVILGVLRGDAGDHFLPASHPSVLATAQHLISAFSFYPVNRNRQAPGAAVGRYPEDRYSGIDFNGGNPWILATAAVAELYYRAAGELKHTNGRAAQSYKDAAEQLLMRIQYHA